MSPRELTPEMVILLNGRRLTYRSQRWQNGETVYDCVDAEGCLRTLDRLAIYHASMIANPRADKLQALRQRAEAVLQESAPDPRAALIILRDLLTLLP